MKYNNKPIYVAIDGGDFVPFGQVKNGIQRLVDSFLKQLLRLSNPKFIFNYYYFSDEAVHPKGGRAQVVPRKLPKKFFATLHLPIKVVKDQNDIFLGFSGYLPKLLQFSKVMKIIFIHDLGFMKFPLLYFDAKKLLRDTRFALSHADKIIVFSEYVKKELMSNFSNIKTSKITRIYAGINHLLSHKIAQNARLSTLTLDSLIGLDGCAKRVFKRSTNIACNKFFLYIGVIKPIKNIKKLLEIFDKFLSVSKDKNYKLVLIGPKEINYFNNLQFSPLFRKLKNKLIFIENVSDKQLMKYYLNATAVLNVSLEEGFCYPVAESLALGRNAIVNNLPIYKEYRKYYPMLFIGQNDKKIVNYMIQFSRSKKTAIKINNPDLFTWNHFSSTLLKELIL